MSHRHPFLSLSPEEQAAVINRARQLRADGVSWKEASRQLGVCVDRLQMHLNPAFDLAAYRARKRAQDARRRDRERSVRTAVDIEPVMSMPLRSDVAARLAEIPADTRDATARFFGDPLPGRSALDRERGARA